MKTGDRVSAFRGGNLGKAFWPAISKFPNGFASNFVVNSYFTLFRCTRIIFLTGTWQVLAEKRNYHCWVNLGSVSKVQWIFFKFCPER